METINLSDFAKAIEKHYDHLPREAAEGYARIWFNKTDPSLYDALQCWIEGKPIPDVAYGDMSVHRILNIRCDHDELRAILLLSKYIQDPDAGLAGIYSPRT